MASSPRPSSRPSAYGRSPIRRYRPRKDGEPFGSFGISSQSGCRASIRSSRESRSIMTAPQAFPLVVLTLSKEHLRISPWQNDQFAHTERRPIAASSCAQGRNQASRSSVHTFRHDLFWKDRGNSLCFLLSSEQIHRPRLEAKGFVLSDSKPQP